MQLQEKIEHTRELIRCWAEAWGVDNIYVAYSGGRDSEILLHIVRSMYPEVKAVFLNTGLEFPEIVRHVRKHDNVVELRPAMPFHKVIEKYGWPVVSKNVSMAISRYRNTKRQDQRDYRLHGKTVNGKKLTAGTIPKKWQYLIAAPFGISEQCCQYLKKNPFKKFDKETGKKPMLGIMGGDSNMRRQDIAARGCNVYDANFPQSRPIGMWSGHDTTAYILSKNLDICSVYSMGYDRTGCVFCMYGIVQEKAATGSHRFDKMKKTHPKLHRYCMEKLGGNVVLNYLEHGR